MSFDEMSSANQPVATAPGVLRVLAMAPNAWNGPWLNRQQLLSRMGRRHTILYSTGPLNRHSESSDSLSTRWRPRVTRQDNVAVDVLPRWMALLLRQPLFRASTMRLIAGRWRRYLGAQGGGPIIGWFFHPRFWPFVNYVRPEPLIYHAYDLYHLQKRWNAIKADHEERFLRRADLVIASSQPIAVYLAERGARNPLVVENAADYSAFAIDTNGTPEPADLMRIGRPRVGYAGALNRKVDFPLLTWLAGRRPQWQFVLIGELGNLDDESRAALAQLRSLPNVHFLGFKPHSDLPGYVARMDVNLLAYRLGPGLWTEGIYPLKLHEYLAAGAPVVSADLSSIRQFHEVVPIARQPSDWEAAIDASLQGRDSTTLAARRAVARENDWDARVKTLEAAIARLVR